MKIHAGHMIKMAAMPIYGKNTLKIFFPGWADFGEIVRSIRDLSPLYFFQIMTLG